MALFGKQMGFPPPSFPGLPRVILSLVLSVTRQQWISSIDYARLDAEGITSCHCRIPGIILEYVIGRAFVPSNDSPRTNSLRVRNGANRKYLNTSKGT